MKVLDVELPRSYRRSKYLDRQRPVIGVDAESLRTGYAFLVADSNGRSAWVKSPEDVLEFFNYDGYADSLLVSFNLDFDAGVLLKWFGEPLCRDLVNNIRISVADYGIEYIPSKYLQFRFGNLFIRIFDVAQYFRGTLEYCANTYLNMSKKDVGGKVFYDKDYGRQDLVEYCVDDAVIAQGLGEYVVTAFNRLDVTVGSLASPAGILESYVLDHLMMRNPVSSIPVKALEMSMHCFSGAWFENFKAGTFPNTYRYDVVSAYPNIVRSLLDISCGDWIHDVTRPQDAVYGYLRVQVDVPRSLRITPIVFKAADGNVFYPWGRWHSFMTWNEVKWLREHGGTVKVYDAWWFVPIIAVTPWSGVVDKFFKVKKNSAPDSMEQWSSKIALAGMYGKFLQHRGGHGGRLYNPVYADEITSRVRLMMADAALLKPDKVIAVMSDCVSSDGPLPLKCGKELGDWSRTGPESTVRLGPVQYEAANQDKVFRRIPWRSLLSSDPNLEEYAVVRTSPMSLVQAVRQNRFTDVGVFDERRVTFNIRKLGWKRFWPVRPGKGGDLLTSRYESKQLNVGSRLRDEDMALWEL